MSRSGAVTAVGNSSNRTKFRRTSLVDPWLASGSRFVFYIWQIVPIVGTSKSINLDLARVARILVLYQRATRSSRSKSPTTVPLYLVLRVLRVAQHGWSRWVGWPSHSRPGLLSRPQPHTSTHTHTHPRHTLTHNTHLSIPPGLFHMPTHTIHPRTRYE